MVKYFSIQIKRLKRHLPGALLVALLLLASIWVVFQILLHQNTNSEYNKKVKDYLEKNSTFSKPIKLARQAEITETEKRIALYKQRFEEVFSKEKDSLMMPIFQEVDSLIKSTSEELNLTVVINKKELLFFSADCIDLQPIIKQKLEKNATLK